MGEGVSLVREADAGDLHVRFDERRLETERKTRIEAPASPATSYSPRRADTAPVVDSPRCYVVTSAALTDDRVDLGERGVGVLRASDTGAYGLSRSHFRRHRFN